MTRVIAVSNQKGGVAKTTTCLSLGACLSEMGKIVLLVDLDPQANLTLSVGLKPKDIRRTVGDALLGNASLDWGQPRKPRVRPGHRPGQ